MAGEDVEKAWKELKEGIVEAASRVCGVVKRTKCRKKRSRWWNEEVREAVKKKKLMYRRLLDTGTEESRREYNEAEVEAKRAVRRAKNEEWVQLGRELEKDASGNQRSFWARVSGSMKAGNCKAQICGRDGRMLVDKEDIRERWKEHFEELYGQVYQRTNTHCAVRFQWMVSWR